MSKRILLIDSDEGFAQGLSSAIKARGFAATLATNSEQGMSLAKQENPDLIVVCVEAQPTNGYMLCTRLKKDDQLKAIPIILTSANATPDSFEKHKKLKTRAEEYLIKPFAPQMMLEKASQLLGVQLPPEPAEEEVVAVEDEPLGLGDLVDGEDEPISLSAADVAQARSALTEEPLVVEEVEEVVELAEEGGGDKDLEMFDKAFDSLGGPGAQPAANPTSRFADGNGPDAAPAAPRPAVALEVDAPADDAVLRTLVQGEEPVAVNDPESQLDARVAELEQRLAERDAELDHARKGAASSTEVIRIKESKNKAEKEILRLREQLNAKDRELVDMQEQQTALESQAQQLKDDAVKREAAAKSLQQRADALAAAAKKFERELTAARDEVKKGGGADARAKIAQLDKELEAAKTEVAALTGEKDLLAEERDDLKKQVEEALGSAEKNEDRAVKAYARIKNEEKLREKARKALEIALQLLEKSAADEEEDDESAKKFA